MERVKEIKTIWNKIENDRMFDREVNEAIKEGYKLLDLKVSEPQINSRATLLYALLIKEYDEQTFEYKTILD